MTSGVVVLQYSGGGAEVEDSNAGLLNGNHGPACGRHLAYGAFTFRSAHFPEQFSGTQMRSL